VRRTDIRDDFSEDPAVVDDGGRASTFNRGVPSVASSCASSDRESRNGSSCQPVRGVQSQRPRRKRSLEFEHFRRVIA
jgi:hypothetical protein